MSILNWFSKVSKPWQVVVNASPTDNRVSEPSDRYGAIVCLTGVCEKGFKAHEVHYCGEPVSQQQFYDINADAAILMVMARLSDEKGCTIEQLGANFPPGDDPSLKAVMLTATQDLASMLGVGETEASLIVLRRLGRGLESIIKQQTP
jgi:hypothetical protein